VGKNSLQLHHFRKYDRLVLVVRDPLSTFLAEFNRQYGVQIGNVTASKTYVAKFEVFKTVAWPEFVRFNIEKWHSFYTNIHQRFDKEKVCTIFYDELLENVVQGK
jgi:hypothetical protein